MANRKNKVWITWEKHRRSRVLSEHFSFTLFEVISSRHGLCRYIDSIYKTTVILFREKPSILIVQNPSMFLALLAIFWKPFLRYTLVVDRHTNFKFDKRHSKKPKWVFFRALSAVTIKLADITVVTNKGLARIVKKIGGRPFVLQDKIPDMNAGTIAETEDITEFAPYLFFVCSFGNDEPVREVVEEYGKISSAYQLIVSGNWSRKFSQSEIDSMPANVTFTGFISDSRFEKLMRDSAGVIVLTNNEFTLNCGAYEALSLNKPLLLSNTLALKEYFSRVANFVDLKKTKCIHRDIASFQNSITHCCYDKSSSDIESMKETWMIRAENLNKIISGI